MDDAKWKGRSCRGSSESARSDRFSPLTSREVNHGYFIHRYLLSPVFTSSNLPNRQHVSAARIFHKDLAPLSLLLNPPSLPSKHCFLYRYSCHAHPQLHLSKHRRWQRATRLLQRHDQGVLGICTRQPNGESAKKNGAERNQLQGSIPILIFSPIIPRSNVCRRPAHILQSIRSLLLHPPWESELY